MMAASERSWLGDVSLSYAAHHFATSGASVAIATAFTHPLDVLKVRLQMQLMGQQGQLVGMGALLAKMTKSEGPRALYLGLAPALTRSALYGGLRLGLYEPCKYVCDTLFGSTNFLAKLASGALSGVVATASTNPMEVLKVRMQVSGKPGSGPIREIHKIITEEGGMALWKGVGPAMTRASALTAAQMATYDESKQALLKWTSLEEDFPLHIISSSIAGTVGTLVTAPVDMVKTRLMLQENSKAVTIYRNGFHCAYQGIGNVHEIGAPDSNNIYRLREAEAALWDEGNMIFLTKKLVSSPYCWGSEFFSYPVLY